MRSAGGSRLAQIGFLKESLSFDAVRTSPARSARPSAPRSRRPTAAGVAVPCVGRGERRATRDGVDATRGRRRRRRAQIVSSDAVQGEERERGNELGGFHFLVLLEDCVAGGDCFFCLCAHRLAPRLLLRAFDSVLEARGLRCGARAAFSTLAPAIWRGLLASPRRPNDF